jgi:hypothetical protein
VLQLKAFTLVGNRGQGIGNRDYVTGESEKEQGVKGIRVKGKG